MSGARAARSQSCPELELPGARVAWSQSRLRYFGLQESELPKKVVAPQFAV